MADKTHPRSSPFIVGVSGHRDLDPGELPRLREAVTAIITRLKQCLPDTELHIILGMAEGADMLVAQTALALGVGIEAVLPMPLDQYADDFDAETLSTLNALLARPEVHRVELSYPAAAAGGSASPRTAAQRDALYANLTDTLIRRSSLLIALWDGHSSPLPGGTADTVLRYLGIRNDDSGDESGVHDADDSVVHFVEANGELEPATRLVYWVPTSRSGQSPTVGVDESCYLLGVGENVLHTQRDMPSLLEHQLEELNLYNREFNRLSASRSLGEIDSLLAGLPPDIEYRDRWLLEDVDAQYGKADALAVYYQRRSDALFGFFGAMTLIMGVAFLIYEKITESRGLLLAYMIILFSSLGIYTFLQKGNWFAKHLTYRVLAETMRTKFYLRLAGVDHRVDAREVLALSGIDRFRGFGWLGYALKGVEPQDVRAIARREPDARESQCVEQSWIENQLRYFTKRVGRLEQASRNVGQLRNAVFVVIIAVMLTLFLFGEDLHHLNLGFGVSVKNLLTFTMGSLAISLAVWQLYQIKMATRELLWQYRNQMGHFARARMHLQRTGAVNRRNDFLIALGKDSLMESYLWTIHRYHREHEPPAGS